MQRKNSWSLGVILIFIIFGIFSASAVRINEIELNPAGNSDNGNEWIELYSENEINITNWILQNANGKNMSFNASFKGYYVLNGSYQFLTDSNQKIKLFDENLSLVYESFFINDSYNDIRSWQYCSGNWSFANSSLGEENLCFYYDNNETEEEEDENGTIDETEEIEIKFDYPDEVEYDEEFSVTLEVSGIRGEYDVKIAVLDDEDSVISKIYDENESKWKSGSYYINNAMEDGDEEDFDLKISKDYVGDGTIQVKIRQNDKILKEEEFDIETIKNKEESETKDDGSNIITNSDEVITSLAIVEDNIYLGKQEKGEYKSKEQIIKEIALLASPLLLLILLGIILINMRGRFKRD